MREGEFPAKAGFPLMAGKNQYLTRVMVRQIEKRASQPIFVIQGKDVVEYQRHILIGPENFDGREPEGQINLIDSSAAYIVQRDFPKAFRYE